jgi:N-acetyl sugar amidotransferase
MIQECTKCLYRATHPFGLTFDSEGVCAGCLTHQEKFDLDWEQRFTLLLERVKPFRKSHRTGGYDCVIPVRGTPEYFYVLDVVRNRLGLNPLVVCYNSQFNSGLGIRNLDLIRQTFDVDLIHYTSSPAIYRKLIRESLVRMNSIRWPFIAGETQFPVQIAVEQQIPLVIWPLHQPTEQVGMHSYTETPEMTRRSRHEFDLMGVEPKDLTNVVTLANAQDVADLHYPEDRRLSAVGVVGIYLSNYIPWDSRRFSEEMIAKFGAMPGTNPRTFDTYDRIDDMTYMAIHDVLKQAKHGYSRVTDNLCREIRFNRISKADALAIEKYYQAQMPDREIQIFLDWLGFERRALQWYLEHLPHGLASSNPPPSLSSTQKQFIAGYKSSGDVFENPKFIVYGKGLDL